MDSSMGLCVSEQTNLSEFYKKSNVQQLELTYLSF